MLRVYKGIERNKEIYTINYNNNKIIIMIKILKEKLIFP